MSAPIVTVIAGCSNPWRLGRERNLMLSAPIVTVIAGCSNPWRLGREQEVVL
jgi:hypothetical protein